MTEDERSNIDPNCLAQVVLDAACVVEPPFGVSPQEVADILGMRKEGVIGSRAVDPLLRYMAWQRGCRALGLKDEVEKKQ